MKPTYFDLTVHDLGAARRFFEAAPLVGGMLAQGIPEYRLPRDIIRAEIERIVRMGVDIRTNWRLGRDFTVADLMRLLEPEGPALVLAAQALQFATNPDLKFTPEWTLPGK